MLPLLYQIDRIGKAEHAGGITEERDQIGEAEHAGGITKKRDRTGEAEHAGGISVPRAPPLIFGRSWGLLVGTAPMKLVG